jgi:hypothetical protein
MADIEVVLGRRRGGAWKKLGYGVYRRRTDAAPPSGPQASGPASSIESRSLGRDILPDLAAWQELLPTCGWFTHLTAAEVHGLWLPPMPSWLPVLVGLPKSETRPKRPELRVLRQTSQVEPVTVQGLRMAPVPEVLLACARDLGLLDLVVLIDSALRRDDCSAAHLRAFAGSRRWGATALQDALALADPRAESPWETVLRVFHVLCEVPVEPQHEVYDDGGVFVARGDLWLPGTKTLHEYDGAVHRERRTHVNDLARDRRLVNAGWVRRGYTSADLLRRPLLILREADAALGRPHDPSRLLPWLAALRESLFSGAGQARLAARWKVIGG